MKEEKTIGPDLDIKFYNDTLGRLQQCAKELEEDVASSAYSYGDTYLGI